MSETSKNSQQNSDLIVLVVMADTPTRTNLDQTFQKAGFHSHLADSGLYALTMLERNPIDLVVIAKEASDMSGWDFYEIVISDTNLRRVVVVLLDESVQGKLDGSSSAIALPQNTQAEQIYKAALSKLRQLGRIGRKTSATSAVETIQGSLDSFFSLVDLILSLTGKGVTGELHFTLAEDANIFFYKGQLLHAIIGHQAGEDALIEIFYQVDTQGNTEYRFESLELERAPEDKRTIDISVEKLLFQVTVELDYRRKGNV